MILFLTYPSFIISLNIIIFEDDIFVIENYELIMEISNFNHEYVLMPCP